MTKLVEQPAQLYTLEVAVRQRMKTKIKFEIDQNRANAHVYIWPSVLFSFLFFCSRVQFLLWIWKKLSFSQKLLKFNLITVLEFSSQRAAHVCHQRFYACSLPRNRYLSIWTCSYFLWPPLDFSSRDFLFTGQKIQLKFRFGESLVYWRLLHPPRGGDFVNRTWLNHMSWMKILSETAAWTLTG